MNNNILLILKVHIDKDHHYLGTVKSWKPTDDLKSKIGNGLVNRDQCFYLNRSSGKILTPCASKVEILNSTFTNGFS